MPDFEPSSGARRRLRIALVGPLPPPFGGMANQTVQLRRLLIAEGLDVEIVQTNRPYSSRLFAKIKGVRAIARLLPYLLELWSQIKGCDCVHVMANSGWSWQLFAAPAIWIGWLKKVPVIVNYRGGEAREYFFSSIRWVAPSLRKASAIVVPSPYLQQVFSEFGFTSQVIPNIVDLERFSFNARLSPQDVNAPVIVVARNLEAIYGIEDAVKAMGILRHTLPNAKLYIAGSGPLLSYLTESVEREGLTNNVEFLGKLDPDEMAALYAKCDIMLNPTTADNMPNSLLEAMAKGIPIVTTDVGGIPFIVRDNETALLVGANQPDMLAAKLKQLALDPDLYEKLAVNGHAEVQKYSWNIVKTQWFNLYRQITP